MQRLENRIPPPVLALLVAAAIWAIGRLAPVPAWPAPLAGAVGAGLFALAGLFGFPALVAFRRARTTIDPVRIARARVLVTDGLYRVTRNPMYVSLTLLLAAWAVYLGSVWGLAGVAAFVLWIDRLQIRPEERQLALIFGPDYAAYRRRVRRWL